MRPEMPGVLTDCSPAPELAAAVIQDTVRFLPVQPSHISNVHGPYLQVKQVDGSSADVTLLTHFRAHWTNGGQQHNGSRSQPQFAAAAHARGAGAGPAGFGAVPHHPHHQQLLERVGGEPHIELAESMQDGGAEALMPPPQDSGAGWEEPPPELRLVAAGAVPAANQQGMVLAQPAADPMQLDAHHALWAAAAAPNPLLLVPRARSEWELDPQKITLGRRLAVGGFAEVFVGKYEGTVVAIKRLLATDVDMDMSRVVAEVRMLARLRHPNLLLFMGFTLAPEPCIVTEFCARGSLYNILRQGGSKPAPPRLQRCVAVAVARGMAYLHSRAPPILHLDLKSPNILLDERWRVKIADFGLSKIRQRTFVSSGAADGTPEWMAPELLRCAHYTEAVDVYSYGVVLWELLTGQPPWADLNAMQVVGAVGFANRSLPDPDPLEGGDEVLLQLCRVCRSVNPVDRPTFAAIVELLNRHFGPSADLQPAPAAGAPQAEGALAGEALLPGEPQRQPWGLAQHPPALPGPSDPMDVGQQQPHHAVVQQASAPAPQLPALLVPHRPLVEHTSLPAAGAAPPVAALQRQGSMQDSPRARRRNRSSRGDDSLSPTGLFVGHSNKLHKLQDGRKTPSPRILEGRWGGSSGSAALAAAPAASEAAAAGLEGGGESSSNDAGQQPGTCAPYLPVVSGIAAPRSVVPPPAAAASGAVPDFPDAPLEQAEQAPGAGSAVPVGLTDLAQLQAPSAAAVQQQQQHSLQTQQLHALHRHLHRHRRGLSMPDADAVGAGPISLSALSAQLQQQQHRPQQQLQLQQLLQAAQLPPGAGRRTDRLDRRSAPSASYTEATAGSAPHQRQQYSGVMHPLALAALRAELLSSDARSLADTGDSHSELSFATNLQHMDCASVGSGSLDLPLVAEGRDEGGVGPFSLQPFLHGHGPDSHSHHPRAERACLGETWSLPTYRAEPLLPQAAPARAVSPFAAFASYEPFSPSLPGLPQSPAAAPAAAEAAAQQPGESRQQQQQLPASALPAGAVQQVAPAADAVLPDDTPQEAAEASTPAAAPLKSWRSGRFRVMVEEVPVGALGASTTLRPVAGQEGGRAGHGALSPWPRPTPDAAQAEAISRHSSESGAEDGRSDRPSGCDYEHAPPASPSPSASAGHLHSEGQLWQRGHGHAGASSPLESPPPGAPPLPVVGFKMFRKGRFFVSTHSAGASVVTASHHHLHHQHQHHQHCEGGLGAAAGGPAASDSGCLEECCCEREREADSASDAAGTASPSSMSGGGSLSGSQALAQEDLRSAFMAAMAAGGSCSFSAALLQLHERLGAVGRQYSRGRFGVTESVVAVPPEELEKQRRRTASSNGLPESPGGAGGGGGGSGASQGKAQGVRFSLCVAAEAPLASNGSSYAAAHGVRSMPGSRMPSSHDLVAAAAAAASASLPRCSSEMSCGRGGSGQGQGLAPGHTAVKKVGRFLIRHEPSGAGRTLAEADVAKRLPQGSPAAADGPQVQQQQHGGGQPGTAVAADSGGTTPIPTAHAHALSRYHSLGTHAFGMGCSRARAAGAMPHSSSSNDLHALGNGIGDSPTGAIDPQAASGDGSRAVAIGSGGMKRVKSKGRFTITITDHPTEDEPPPEQHHAGLPEPVAASPAASPEAKAGSGTAAGSAVQPVVLASPALADAEHRTPAVVPALGAHLEVGVAQQQQQQQGGAGGAGQASLAAQDAELHADMAAMLRQQQRTTRNVLRWADQQQQPQLVRHGRAQGGSTDCGTDASGAAGGLLAEETAVHDAVGGAPGHRYAGRGAAGGQGPAGASMDVDVGNSNADGFNVSAPGTKGGSGAAGALQPGTPADEQGSGAVDALVGEGHAGECFDVHANDTMVEH